MNHIDESDPGYQVNTFSKWQTSEITFIKCDLSHNLYKSTECINYVYLKKKVWMQDCI